MSTLFGFVVLNYTNYQETIDCVDSITRLPGDNFRIVVVDNHSPNDSCDVLRERFAGDARISVLQSGRNGGYSFGNNTGIAALRRAGIVDVIIATSDTRVEDALLLERCTAAKQAGVAVLGPYVRDPNDAPQNPMEAHLSLRYIAALSLGPAWDALRRLLSRTRLRRTLHIGVPGSIRTQGAAALVDVYMVHGCFLYLSEHYLNQFPLLDEDLFMYGEEDLIAFNCLRKRLRVAYDPQMRVHHRDAKSTRSGDFRNQAVVASMRALRAKIGFTRLVHAYLSARRH